jgi:hypothetical protein
MRAEVKQRKRIAARLFRNATVLAGAMFCLGAGAAGACAATPETCAVGPGGATAGPSPLSCSDTGQAPPNADERGPPTTLMDRPEVSQASQGLYAPPGDPANLGVHGRDWGVFNRDGGYAAGFGPVGRYGATRWAEDWSFLRDPKLRRANDDPFDILKYIPLSDSGSIYLSFSGEERLKNWFENRPGLGTIKPNDSGRMTLQSIYGADLHIGPQVRLYGELVSAQAGGWGGYGYNAGYRTRLDLLQGFLELNDTVLGAKSGLMIGRMEFLDAPNYVFYQRTVSSVPQSWNGGRFYMIWPRVRIDLFDFVQTNITPTAIFHDEPSWSTRLYGAYESYALPDFRFLDEAGHVFFDLFYFGYQFTGSSAAITSPTGLQSGATRRDNYGTRIWGKAGPIEFSLGALYQGGQFSAAETNIKRPVSAYSINTSVGWRFSNVPYHPLLGIQTDIYSGGNRNKTSGTIGTYTTPYIPLSSYLDTTYYAGTSNLIAVSPVIEASLAKTLVLRLKSPVLWRDSTNDAFYSPSAPYSFVNFRGGYAGVVPQATLSIEITHHLRWNHDIARFFVSNGLQKAGGSDGTYYLSTLSFIF